MKNEDMKPASQLSNDMKIPLVLSPLEPKDHPAPLWTALILNNQTTLTRAVTKEELAAGIIPLVPKELVNVTMFAKHDTLWTPESLSHTPIVTADTSIVGCHAVTTGASTVGGRVMEANATQLTLLTCEGQLFVSPMANTRFTVSRHAYGVEVVPGAFPEDDEFFVSGILPRDELIVQAAYSFEASPDNLKGTLKGVWEIKSSLHRPLKNVRVMIEMTAIEKNNAVVEPRNNNKMAALSSISSVVKKKSSRKSAAPAKITSRFVVPGVRDLVPQKRLSVPFCVQQSSMTAHMVATFDRPPPSGSSCTVPVYAQVDMMLKSSKVGKALPGGSFTMWRAAHGGTPRRLMSFLEASIASEPVNVPHMLVIKRKRMMWNITRTVDPIVEHEEDGSLMSNVTFSGSLVPSVNVHTVVLVDKLDKDLRLDDSKMPEAASGHVGDFPVARPGDCVVSAPVAVHKGSEAAFDITLGLPVTDGMFACSLKYVFAPTEESAAKASTVPSAGSKRMASSKSKKGKSGGWFS